MRYGLSGRRSGSTGPAVPARAAPPAGSDARLARARVVARILDNQFRVPGTSYRVGIDPLIGLVPGVGDTVSALLSLWVLVTAARLGAPPAVLARMGLNISVDTLAGAIPLVGDLFDAGYKANVRNLRLLESWVQRPAPTRRASRVRVLATVVVAVALVFALLFAVWTLVAWAFSAVGS